MQHLDTTAGRVAYLEAGAGPPIVLLHANAHDHSDFLPIVPLLATDHRVLALDWPGHGQSAWGEAPPELTAARLAATLAEVVEQLDLEDAVFVGCSVGGFAASRLAIDHPERVAGLVLVNSGGYVKHNVVTRAVCRILGSERWSRRLMPRFIDAYMRAQSPEDHAIVERTKARAATDDGTAFAAALWRSFLDPAADVRLEAHRIACPTLLLWGKDDPTLGARVGRKIAALVPGAQLVLLPTGHVPFSSRPELFLEHLRPFLDRARSIPR